MAKSASAKKVKAAEAAIRAAEPKAPAPKAKGKKAPAPKSKSKPAADVAVSEPAPVVAPAKPDPKAPVKIAVSATEFALVSPEDFGFVLYHSDWRLGAGGFPVGKGVSLREFVAKRMGLDPTKTVVNRSGDKLDCTRGNLAATDYVWGKATVKIRLDVKGEDPRWEDREAHTYGTVALFKRESKWVLLHTETGYTLGACWSTIDTARAGTERIHAEGNFDELKGIGSPGGLTKKQHAKWNALVAKHREAFA